MSPAGSTSVPHHLGVVLSLAGRFMECINCRLRLEFPVGANYSTKHDENKTTEQYGSVQTKRPPHVLIATIK